MAKKLKLQVGDRVSVMEYTSGGKALPDEWEGVIVSFDKATDMVEVKDDDEGETFWRRLNDLTGISELAR